MLSVADMKERFHHDCLLAMAILREAGNGGGKLDHGSGGIGPLRAA